MVEISKEEIVTALESIATMEADTAISVSKRIVYDRLDDVVQMYASRAKKGQKIRKEVRRMGNDYMGSHGWKGNGTLFKKAANY